MPSTSRGYPYPSNSSPATVPADLEKLASAINGDVQTLSDTSTQNATNYDELASTVAGIKSIVSVRDDDGDGIATIHYTNGSSESIPLPRGQRGEDGKAAGPFVDLIDNGDGTATVVLHDGTERTLTLPPGPPGQDGQDGADGQDGQDGDPGPANALSIGSVTSGDTPSATITGTPPNQVLDLVLPKGEKGDTGDGGEVTTPDTGDRYIGTEAGGANIGNAKVRRVGSLVALSFSGAIPASGSLRWVYPTGFKPIDSMTGHRAGWNITTKNLFPFQVAWNATTVPASGGGPVAGDYVSAVVQYITADPWPSTLPGTPG